MDIKLALLFFFITAIIALSYLADKNVDRIFRIKAPAANKVPPHVHPTKIVYADVN